MDNNNTNNNFNQQNNYGHPQYQQPQQQYQQPGMQYQQPPVPGPQQEYTVEDRRMANILCIVSLICMFAIPTVVVLFMSVIRDANIVSNEDALDKLTDLFIFIIGAAHIAAWVLMILVRVKYKHSTFGKILMVVYLILLALAVIGVIVLIVSCISCLRDCNF